MRNNQRWSQCVFEFACTEVLRHWFVSMLLFFCFPKKKSNQKKRGHSNMLPYAHSGAPPHLSEATAHASNNTCTSKLPAHDQLLAEKEVSLKFSPIYEASIHTDILSLT